LRPCARSVTNWSGRGCRCRKSSQAGRPHFQFTQVTRTWNVVLARWFSGMQAMTPVVRTWIFWMPHSCWPVSSASRVEIDSALISVTKRLQRKIRIRVSCFSIFRMQKPYRTAKSISSSKPSELVKLSWAHAFTASPGTYAPLWRCMQKL